MRLLLVGPPGSGKGTQARLLHERLNFQHIGTGDLLREAIKRNTPAGQHAKPFVDQGSLVPDTIVNEMVEELMSGKEHPDHFVLDGYPRTLTQATFLDGLLQRVHLELDAVVHLDVADEIIIERLAGEQGPPSDRGERSDDNEETIRRRLKIYHDNHDKILDHYENQGLVRKVPATESIETVYKKIVEVITSTAS
ncbi:MAG: adenylate kinase [Gemmataceae bacterium]